jgi:hypothetical protein
MARMARIERHRSFFSDFDAVIHFLCGVTCAYLSLFHFLFSFLIIVIFTCYQIIESRNRYETFYDFLEFSVGVISFFVLILILN